MQEKNRQKGAILVYIIIVIAIFLIITPPLVANFLAKMQLMRLSMQKEQAFQIAEAGINYYQWHLAHYQTDYTDYQGVGALPDALAPGTVMGPFEHDYTDKDTQEVIGRFSLLITSPLAGSTIVTIQSTGWTTQNPNIKRTITVRYGIPSLAKYSILNNGEVWIYYSPQIFSGQVHSNNGVRFDVQGNAPIFSAKETYTTDCFGFCSYGTRNGVWGSGNPSFWQFPVPAIDFSAFTSDLADLKDLADPDGIYLPPSNKEGYSLVFNSNGTVSVYKVKTRRSNPTGHTYDVNMNWITITKPTDYNQRDLQFTRAIPSNGAIYIEDNVWIEGTVQGRVTVAAAKLPYSSSTAPTVYIPNNIVYQSKDGSDVLGIIGQKDVVPTYYAPNDLEVDAAVISQNSMFSFYYYPGNIKNSISIYGAIIEFGWWFDNFVWTSGIGSTVLGGYTNSYYTYDSNLLYAPPPYFPLSSSGYQQINWISE